MTEYHKIPTDELIRMYGGEQIAPPGPKKNLFEVPDEELRSFYRMDEPLVNPVTTGDLLKDMAVSAPRAAYRGVTALVATPGALDALMSGGVNAVAGAVGAEQHPRLFGPGGGVSNLIGSEVGGEGGQRLAASGVLPTPGELEARISGRNRAFKTLPEPQYGPAKISSAAIEGGIGSFGLGAGGAARSFGTGAMAGGLGEAAGQGAESLGSDPLMSDIVRLGATLATGATGNMRKPRDVSPSRAALVDEAKATFEAARAKGQVIDQTAVADFADEAIQTAVDMGRSQIKGAAQELTPKTEAVLSVINDASLNGQPLSELHNLRQTINTGISEAKPGGADQKILMAIRGKMDDWIEKQKGGPELMKGIRLWSRVRKSDTLAEMEHDAKINANPSRGYTYSEALKQEYRKLARSDRMKTFSRQEQKAIESVVNGGSADAVYQAMAGFYPFSVSGALRSGITGGGFGGGALLSGAGGGSGALAAAFPIAGIFGKAASNALTRKNAAIADMLVRGGAGTPMPRGPLLSGIPLSLYYGNMATQGPQ